MMVEAVAVIVPGGAHLCVDCAFDRWQEDHSIEEEWLPQTGVDLADHARRLFEAISPDAVGLYPEFAEADLDPFSIAQLEAVPYCDRCGRFLVRLEGPIERGGAFDR